MKHPKLKHMTPEEIKKLIIRVEAGELNLEDSELFMDLLRFNLWLLNNLQQARITIWNLRKVFDIKTEKKKKLKKKNKNISNDSANENNNSDEKEDDEPAKTNTENKADNDDKAKEDTKAGHGRLSFDDYKGLLTRIVLHELYKPGDTCPLDCTGNLYDLKNPGKVIKVTGNVPVTGIRLLLQKLRCSSCGQVFTAAVPSEYSEDKYDESARAIMAILKYYLGMPFYRLQNFQAMAGIPLPDSTQFDEVEKVADAAYPVFKLLIKLSAQGSILYHDDTKAKILTLLKENEDEKTKRKGIYTTAIVSVVDKYKIYTFHTGRNHAGENLNLVLNQRVNKEDKPMQMSDALAANETELDTIVCKCLSHGRRKFYNIYNHFPDECGIVINTLSVVYHNDKKAREAFMNDDARLAFHQKHSKKEMDKLKSWMEKQIEDDLVEANSSLGEAINYMLKRWPELTRFLEVPGAPLDNNICLSSSLENPQDWIKAA